MSKSELRAQMRARNREIAPEAREAAAKTIAETLERDDAFAGARTVALFAALPDEPPTAAMLAAWSAYKRIVLPRVEGQTMQFYDYRPNRTATGAFGIEEPEPQRLCPPEAIDLIVCPGVAFAADGTRLGRGKGYYDRYLSQPGMRAVRIGICYRHQLVDTLPSEPHDIRMQRIVTG